MTAGQRQADTAAAADMADMAATRALLRCWIRETGVPRPADDVLRLELSGRRLVAAVRYWSPCGWHEFGPVRVAPAAARATADSADTADTAAGDTVAGATTVATLIAREACLARGHGAAAIADLVDRVTDSTRRMSRYLAERRGRGELDAERRAPGFLAAEQALILGHPMHPTPKSRDGLSDAEDAAYAPELRGAFPLHWFAADPRVVRAGSALDRTAARLLASIGPEAPPGAVLVPAHPWQARAVRAREGVRGLLADGLLRDLGPAGPPWSATSSVRTVYRGDLPLMLKLSLGLRITNSRREHLAAELPRGEEIHRLLDGGLGAAMRAAHPGFRIVRDPAWLSVGAGDVPTGLDVVIRENPFGARGRAGCLAGLLAERPDLPSGRSLLAGILHRLAGYAGRPVPEIAAEWFDRYLDAVVVPVLWMYGTYGLGVEAHQQNTLVELDDQGWPAGGWYRDNQGYYVSPTRGSALFAMLPGLGRDSDAVNPDKIIDERLSYYVGINNLFGLIGALGGQRLADEYVLLARGRSALERLARSFDHPPDLLTGLLESPVLRCKANLLTRVDGLDELVGPVETQSVYVDVPNPLVEVSSR